MNATLIRHLVAAAIVAGLLGWLVLRYAYSVLPPLPWTMILTMLLLALAELVSALNTRARLQRKPGTRPVEPLVVARLAVAAKASAYTAAIVAGAYAGALAYVLPDVHQEAQRYDAIVGGTTVVAAALFGAAALFLERACRVPEPPDRDDGHPS